MTATVNYRLHFPRDLTPDQVLGVLLALNGRSTVQALPIRLPSVVGRDGSNTVCPCPPVGRTS